MPSTSIEPVKVTHFPARGESGVSGPSPRTHTETTAPAAEEVSPPLTLITEHEVMLGTAAALAPAPSFADAAVDDAVAWGIRGWIAALARLFTKSPDRRQHCPPRIDFMEDARMAREMYRL